MSSLYSIYATNPIYGVEYKWRSNKEDEKSAAIIADDIEFEEIEEPKSEMSNTLTAYMADEGHEKDRPAVYSNDLGLATESVKEGFTIQKLWEVIPS